MISARLCSVQISFTLRRGPAASLIPCAAAMPPSKRRLSTKARHSVISLLATGVPRRRLRDAVRAARCLDETEVDRRFLDRRIFDTTPVHQLHLPLHNGKTCCLEHIDGHAMLQILVSEVPTASTMFKERLAVKPLPWTLILAADEGWCGNNLSVSGRKVQIWSYSFLELGPENLALSCAWLTPMLMRSTIQGKTIGGCSAVSALLLQHLLLSPESGFASVGCPLKVGLEQQPVVLTANDVVRALADGEGHRHFSRSKAGADSGSVPFAQMSGRSRATWRAHCLATSRKLVPIRPCSNQMPT